MSTLSAFLTRLVRPFTKHDEQNRTLAWRLDAGEMRVQGVFLTADDDGSEENERLTESSEEPACWAIQEACLRPAIQRI